MVLLGGGALSDERGTPVGSREEEGVGCGVWNSTERQRCAAVEGSPPLSAFCPAARLSLVYEEGRYKATWKSESKLPWLKASPLESSR